MLDDTLSDHLTVQEAAQELGLADSTLRIALSEGRLPFTVQFGRKLITRNDLEAYRQRTQPTGSKKNGRPKKVREGRSVPAPDKAALSLATPNVTMTKELPHEQGVMDDKVILRRLGLDDPSLRAKLVWLEDEDWSFLYSNFLFVCAKHNNQANEVGIGERSNDPASEKSAS